MAFAKPSLKGRALRLLSQREHSRAELERKLVAYEEEPGSLSQALDELQTRGFINEARVVESVIHRRAAKLGALRIRMELQEKGLDPQLIDQAVTELRDTELYRASEIWRKKYNTAPDSPQEKARQARYLAARGFATDVILQTLKRAGNPDDRDAF